MSSVIYYHNNILLTDSDVKAMAKIFNFHKICEKFKINPNLLSNYIRMYVVFKAFVNSSNEQIFVKYTDDFLKSIDLSIDILKSNFKITNMAINILLVCSVFFQLQDQQFQQQFPIKSPFVEHVTKQIFDEKNNTIIYKVLIDNKKIDYYNSDNINFDLLYLLKNTKQFQEFQYCNKNIRILAKNKIPKKHLIYKYYYLVLKNVNECDIKSLVFSIDFYTAAAIVAEIKLHYGLYIEQNVLRTVCSSSVKSEDQNIVHALESRYGKCFFHTSQDKEGNNYTTILIVDQILEQEMKFIFQTNEESNENIHILKMIENIKI